MACLACGAVGPGHTVFGWISRCAECGLGRPLRDVKAADLRAAYTQSYFVGLEYVDYEAERQALQKNFRDRIATLRQYQPGGRLFEIGCAYGYFLEIARSLWTVGGCDVSEHACAYARDVLKLDVLVGDFAELDGLPPGSHDVVCMWDTIEHLYDPARAVARAAEALKPGGILAITTGDFDSLSARLQRGRWRLLHMPTHVYFFGARSLRRLLGRHGLEVVAREYPGNYRSTRQIAYQTLWTSSRSRRLLYRLLDRTGILDRDLYMNLYDIMFVIARKASVAAAAPAAPRSVAIAGPVGGR